MKTIILGKRSALTRECLKSIDDVYVIGTEDLKKKTNLKFPRKFNLIINLFYSSKKIGLITDYDKYFKYSIYYLTEFFSRIKIQQINKLIYSSSSAVYGDLLDMHNKRNFYASTKILVENYLKNLKGIKNKLIITRLFNLYDKDDNFSIISKIIKCKKDKKKIIIFNNGDGIRDFIKISDVAKIYKKILKKKFSGTIDIGTGEGIQIKNLIDSIGLSYAYKKNLSEQKISIANISKLNEILPNFNYYKLENFFKKFNLKIKKKLLKIKIPSEKENEISENITLIYGAGYSGKKLYHQVKQTNKKENIFFIDDNKKLQNKYYHNSPIISFNKFQEINKLLKIKNIYFAIPSLDLKKRNFILKKIIKYNDAIMVLPAKNQIINDEVSFNDLKKVNYLDIISKKTSSINNKLIEYLNYTNVLITGAAGSIGSELVLQIIKTKAKKIVCLDINETELFRLKQKLQFEKRVDFIICDINYSQNLKNIIKRYKINNIFHAAAYKHVEMLETNVDAAVKNNIKGTLSLIKSLNENVKNLIVISTDKAAKPINILGITKRFTELMCIYFSKKIKTNLKVVRFGNVFGSRGSAIEIFDNQIKNNLPITITSYKAERYFMSITEACNLVMQCSQLKTKGDIYLLNMGKQIKIYKIINKMLKFYNLKNYPIKKIGLKKGEKLKEILAINNKKINTKHKDIFSIKEKKFSFNSIKEVITMIEQNNNSSLIINKIRKIKNL